jgi:hypothetical protein
MKKLFLLVSLVLLVCSISFSQVWFQASMEHKLNKYAGLSVSNELGYNFNFPGNTSFAPSVDYTYFSDGTITQTLLFECLTATLLFPIKNCDFLPYASVSGAHLDTFPVHQEGFGGSFQLGTGFLLTKNTQLFFQYRYFDYGSLLQGQLTQFGFMYTFGG